jgi:hypothetical protein
MREVFDLLLHRGNDCGIGCTHCRHSDTGTEVDKRVAVDIDDNASVSVGDVNGQGRRHARADYGFAALSQRY